MKFGGKVSYLYDKRNILCYTVDMKKISKRCLGAFLACALVMAVCAGCASVTAHNSRNSLDWPGTYAGSIPSASGMGIEVRLTLNRDGAYILRYHYVERENPDFSMTGNFTWDRAGSVITLDSNTGPNFYQVGENMLRQLDLEGKVITGNLAEMYILRKE